MKLTELVPDYKKATLKERKFFKALIKYKVPAKAARVSYNCKDALSAAVIGSKLLKKFNISMNELLDASGLDIAEDIKDLKRLRQAKMTKFFAHEGAIVDEAECDDNTTQLKALELTLKLKGHLRDKVEVSGEISAKGFGNTIIIVRADGTTESDENKTRAIPRSLPV